MLPGSELLTQFLPFYFSGKIQVLSDIGISRF